MPIVGMPEFEKSEVLTAAALNAWMTAIETKFNAGINGEDFRWPFNAAGDIDLDGNEFVGLKKLWGQLSLKHRYSHTTAQSVFDQIGLTGGLVKLPGGTTQPCSDGLFIKSNTTVQGDGWSSAFTGTLKVQDAANVVVERCRIATTLVKNSSKVTFKYCVFAGDIDVQFSKDVVFRHCTFESGNLELARNDGVEFYGCTADYQWSGWLIFTTGQHKNLRIKYCYYNNSGSASGAVTTVAAGNWGARDDGVRIESNLFTGDAAVNTLGATNVTVSGNVIASAASTIVARNNSKTFSVRANLLYPSDDGILVGNQVAYTNIASNYGTSANRGTIESNQIYPGGSGLFANAPIGTILDLEIRGNTIVGGSDPAIVISGLRADPSTAHLWTAIFGNMCEDGGLAGFRANVAVTSVDQGGDIGSATYSTLPSSFIEGDYYGKTPAAWFTLVGNIIQGFDVGPGADKDASTDSDGKSVVAGNVV